MARETTGTAARKRLIRYGATALIVLVIGGLFVQRELLTDDPEVVGAQGATTAIGLVDDHDIGIGKPVPDFVLQDLHGNPITLSDFRGKTIVLNFWATWCPPCRAEMPDLQEVYDQRLDQDDLVVLAVDLLSEDNTSAVADFIEEFALTFPVVLAADESVVERYGVRGLPATFFIDRDGVLRSRNLGPVFGDLLPDGIALADAAGGTSGS